MGIPTIRVDGNDVLACYHATHKARQIALQQTRPVLIEAMTYRISHHSTSDDSSVYRSNNEVKEWREQQHPMNRLEQLLRKHNLFDEKEQEQLKKDTRKQIIDIMNVQEKLAKPPLEEMFNDVYQEMPDYLAKQYSDLVDHLKVHADKYPQNFDNFHQTVGQKGE